MAFSAKDRDMETRMREDSAELLRRWQSGDHSAAAMMFRRYFARLHAFAGSRLSERLAARLDADDVVQSAFRVFFSNARDGRYVLEHAGDLWRLLAAIAISQVRHVHKRHNAEKRALAREQLPLPLRDAVDEEDLWMTSDPTPQEAAMLAEEVQQLLRPLSPARRRLVELRLQGFTLDEIAAEIGCSERTIRRALEQIKQQYHDRDRGQE
jgi:RNA polymerase sigma factor (sigma-70 family)